MTPRLGARFHATLPAPADPARNISIATAASANHSQFHYPKWPLTHMLSADDDGMQSHRCILTGLATSLAGIPIAAMLTDPVLARAAAQELEGVTLRLYSGREIAVFLAVPDQTPAPTVEFLHEWWGLNDQIKTISSGFCAQLLCSTRCQRDG